MSFLQRNWSYSFIFYLPLYLFLAVIQVNVDIKMKSKERISFVVVVVFLSLKVPGWLRHLLSKRVCTWNAKFHSGLHEWVEVRTYGRRAPLLPRVTVKAKKRSGWPEKRCRNYCLLFWKTPVCIFVLFHSFSCTVLLLCCFSVKYFMSIHLKM